MADISYIDVTSLAVVPDGVQNDDVLLLVRSNADGTKTCYRVPGSKFKGDAGRSAYDVAKEQGYTGTLADWEAQVAKVSRFNVSYDADTGEIVFRQ